MFQFHMRKILLFILGLTVLFVIYILSFSDSMVVNSKETRLMNQIEKLDEVPTQSMPKDLLDFNFGNNLNKLSSEYSWTSNGNGKHMKSKGGSSLFSGDKLVHLDLKGAPPKMSYFDDFFPLIKKLGATGLLIEYEDMFPYSSIDVSATNSYSKTKISYLLNKAKENHLEVIPLIQTFGHLEFLLKLKAYEHLREVPHYPQVVCPSHNSTMPVLRSMIDDIMALHPGIRYLHIGCDEVYNLAECNRCLDIMVKNNWSKHQLFLNHINKVAQYIKDRYPGVKPLVWDDELRKLSETELAEFNLGSLVEPVVWKYTPDIDTYLPDTMWDKYASLFGSVWIASAFKGATGVDKLVTDIEYHWENHRAWMKLVASYKERLKFKGIMMTGWQRYDHFSILCELLPVGLPSLAVNLGYLSQGKIELRSVPPAVQEILKCGPGLLHPKFGARCNFPGSIIYEKAQQLQNLIDLITQMEESSEAKGWLTQYNYHTGFSSPAHVEGATNELDRFKMEMVYLEQDLRRGMADVFDSDTIKEWIYTHMTPVNQRLQTMWEIRERLLSHKVWPRRPLEIHDHEL